MCGNVCAYVCGCLVWLVEWGQLVRCFLGQTLGSSPSFRGGVKRKQTFPIQSWKLWYSTNDVTVWTFFCTCCTVEVCPLQSSQVLCSWLKPPPCSPSILPTLSITHSTTSTMTVFTGLFYEPNSLVFCVETLRVQDSTAFVFSVQTLSSVSPCVEWFAEWSDSRVFNSAGYVILW